MDRVERYLSDASQSRSPKERLQQVLGAVETYLPRHIVRLCFNDPRSPAVSGEFVQATLLFADISGFTAMSERLSQLGREGAEVITGIVNSYFATMLDVIDRNGGDLFKFGGDALLVCFRGDQGAARGCQAALQMQQAMDRFKVIDTTQGAFGLQMTAALGTGTLFLSSLGSADRLEFAVMGSAIEQMAEAEHLAQAGEVLIDQATRDAAGGDITARERAPGFHHLLDLPATPETSNALPNLAPGVEWLVERLDALTPYLPPELLARIISSPGRRMFEGEHRPVTVLFANFYGINEIIEALSPEQPDELTEILNRHFTAMRDVIHKYGGIVNKIDTYAVGYRIMALFGAPLAHEDDPERAVHAALEMQEVMAGFADLSTSAGHFSLKQRIGVNTGYVFAGNLGSTLRQEYSVMGDEVNLTSRLMGIAAEGRVLISQSTANHVRHCFQLQQRDLVQVKGKSEPVNSYQVERTISSGAHWTAPSGDFFGRENELARAQSLVHEALAGRGAVLDVSGEAGVGKTRLIVELSRTCGELGMTMLQGEAISYLRSLPYLPWNQVLQVLLGSAESDDEGLDRRRIKLMAVLEQAGLANWAPIVGTVLGIEIAETPLTASLDAQLRQQRFFDVVLQLLQQQAERSPLLLVLDDMQWADDTSLDLVAYVARNVGASPILFVIVHRPDLDANAWCTSDACRRLDLEVLDDESSLALARSALGGEPLSPSLCQLILDRAQGNPLFVEEIARALSESGIIQLATKDGERLWAISEDAADAQVPTTLTGLIMSRIDRLERANRHLLQVAAVVGRAFRSPVLARTYPYDDLGGTLPARLSQLTELDLLLYSPPDEYVFKHTLTQEVAYESLSFARRRELHVRVGEDIEQAHAGDLAEQFGVLARHFERGQVYDKAFTYLVQAGDRAGIEFANAAALDDYRRALEIAAQQKPDLPNLPAQILEVLEAMGDIHLLTSRYDEATGRFGEALGQPECTPRHQGDLLLKIAKAHELQGLYDQALDYADRARKALSSDEADRQSVEMARSYNLSGWVHMRRGEIGQAIADCEQGLAILGLLPRKEERLRDEAEVYNTLGAVHVDLKGDYAQAAKFYQRSSELYEQASDLPGLTRTYNNLARTAWAQGDLEGAGHYLQRMLEISQQMGHNYALAFGYNNLGVISYTTGDVEQALEHYHSALVLRQRMGDSYGAAQTCSNLGEAYLSLEEHDEARRYLEQAAAAFEAIQSEGELPEVYCLLAETELARGEVALALDYAGRAQQIAASLGNAELQGTAKRVLARGQARSGEGGQARQSFEASIELLRASGHQIELARSHYEYGLLLAEQGADPQQARSHLQQAVDLFEAAGAEKQAQQARAALP